MANDAPQNRADDNLEFQKRTTGASGGMNTSADQPYSRDASVLPPGEDPPSKGPGTLGDQTEDEHGDFLGRNLQNEQWLIQQAHEMYNLSTDYLDANITNFWERSLSHFHNEHAPGTPYRRKDFRRSRVFRPKTRANIKAQESGLANAMFATLKMVSVQPEDERDQKQLLSAAVNQELMQWRLENTIPWFLTAMGAYQDTKVYGLCISHQFWDYREDLDVVPALDDTGKLIFETNADGDKQMMGEEQTIIRADRPRIDLVEPENFRFDPMCDWRDPAGTSPFIIRLVPMTAGEALEMMETDVSKTSVAGKWKKHSLAEILGTRRQDYDRTRQAREGRDRIDPADEQRGNEFTTVWAHLNILRIDGTDYIYWTMGTELLLTNPVKLKDEYPWLREGERPFVVGYSSVETHRNYPSGDVEQGSGVQEEINMVANQRLDNVKLVLNKRYYVRRGSQVDLDALIRNTPGGGVMMNDPEKDVVTVNTPDVTGSSYNEQALLSQEYDELVGGFNPATAGQKSVGGMTMAGAAANSVQDYGIKIFMETWVEPVLRQMVRLEQMYETDEVILALAAQRAQAHDKFGVDRLTDSILMQNLRVKVDVGMGNTDPMRRVERLIFGVTKAVELPGMAMRLKGSAVTDEIFGALGYKDASAFFMSEDEWAQFQEANPPGPSEIDVKMRELDIRESDNQMRDAREREKNTAELEDKAKERMVRQDMKTDELNAGYSKAQMTDQTTRDLKAADVRQASQDRVLKAVSGGGGGNEGA